MRRALITLVCLTLLGCSSDADRDNGNGNEPEKPSQAAVAAQLAELFGGLSPESAGEAACFGEALASRRSADQLRDAGLLDSSYQAAEKMPKMSRGLAGDWVDSWFGCVEFTKVASRAQRKVTRTLDVPGFERCLSNAVTDAQIRAAAVDLLSGEGSSPAAERLSQALAGCATKNK